MNNQIIQFPDGEQTLQLPGAVGKLEAIVATPTITPLYPVTAVICHPHPQQQGTMHNKVVTTLHRCCRDIGVRTVRFNYRGVDNSDGQFANAIGEVDDLLAIIAWVKQVCPQDALWLFGFSFGAGIVLNAAAQTSTDIGYIVCVAPGVDRDYFHGTPPDQCPWLVVQGGADEVIDPNAVTSWVQGITNNPPRYCYLPDVDHFFHSKLVMLRDTLRTALLEQLPTMD